MTLLVVVVVLSFDIILCIVEIPNMLKNKLNKELWIFSVLLLIGTVLVILKSLNVKISNPSDWVDMVYSPITDLMKDVFE